MDWGKRTLFGRGKFSFLYFLGLVGGCVVILLTLGCRYDELLNAQQKRTTDRYMYAVCYDRLVHEADYHDSK